jgi:hypothetical protein
MARTIHEVLDYDRELYTEFRKLSENPERLDEMAAIMEGCNYSAEFNLMRRALGLSRRVLEFEHNLK